MPLIRTDESIPTQLLKAFSDIPRDASGDILGKIYEYFLGNFALAEGQGGGQFFTPTSVVRLMVEIIEPYQGKVYDPACGSGGMFVQSQRFIEDHRQELEALGESHDGDSIFVYGQEKTLDTVKLAKMNLAVNGLRGDIKQDNSYAEDPYNGMGKFDFVMAYPPFNVDDVAVATVEGDHRFNTYGIPRNKNKTKKSQQGKETVPNGNYLWINLFATSLTGTGHAALVMANSASDARHSEADIRNPLIENNLIYGMLTLPSNMFYTVTLPATLWFFDKSKQDDRILFIDARNVFTQIDRAHREFSEAQIQNLAIISKLHQGKSREFLHLIQGYVEQGEQSLIANQALISPLIAQLRDVLTDETGKAAADQLETQWQGVSALKQTFTAYQAQVKGKYASKTKVEIVAAGQNISQRDFAWMMEAERVRNIALERHSNKEYQVLYDAHENRSSIEGCKYLHSEIYREVEKTIVLAEAKIISEIGNAVFLAAHHDWCEFNKQRESYILSSVNDYLSEKYSTISVLFIGAAHGNSIVSQVNEYNNATIDWKIYTRHA